MMKRHSLTVVALAVFLAGGCGGGGGDGPEDDGLPVADKITSAAEQLAAGDIASARATYTAIIGDAVKEVDANNSEARFGRALCDMILLIEKAPFDAILAGFGQSPWKVSTVFGPDGFLAKSLAEPPLDQDALFSALPFYNVKTCWQAAGKTKLHQYRCALSQAAAGFSTKDLIARLADLEGHIDGIIADLKVAISDAAASFTIPKGLYSGDADISVNHADMVEILGGMYATKATTALLGSWDFNIDLSTLVDANGTPLVTSQQVVDLLNAQFALRSDNRLTTARDNMQNWVGYTKQGLSEILAGSTSGVLNLSDDNKPIYQDLLGLIDSAEKALGGEVLVAGITPDILADLDRFFNKPPDGAATELDPFVLEGGGKIRPVEAYWQQAINSACNFQIGTNDVKVFSDAVRAMRDPYTKLFGTIIGHSFGRYKAGGN